MSSVDDRIVNMKFNGSQFKQGAVDTLSILDKLKTGLDMKGASKGLEDVSAASKGITLGPLGDAVEGVSLKFAALATAGITALANITNRAVDAGITLAKSLTIDPVKAGFDEYELKMGSIQTIMAGTGQSLDVVNEKLAALNTYSDRTIYSFQDMTQNIGKFTNAGVDLDTAVASIQGISNVAALSGANAEEASRAMYNFSQALSSGSVKLMDWKSIENANMATVEFKTQLLESALAAGTLTKSADGMYKTVNGKGLPVSATKGFNESLTEQWLTTEVLNKTLGDYSDETTEIGKKAFAAAQDIKTFSQMIDTMKEGVGSGWAQTWELIFGDFEEGKALWTGVNNVFDDIISKSSDSRNALLSGWKELGGRENLLAAIANTFEAFMQILKPIGEALKNVFPPITAERLAYLTMKLKLFTEDLKVNGSVVNKVRRIFEGIFTVFKIAGMVVGAVAKQFVRVFKAISGGSGDLLKMGATIGDMIVKFAKWLEETDKLTEIFNKLGGIAIAVLKPIANVISNVAKAMTLLVKGDVDGFIDGLKNSFGPLGSIIDGVTYAFEQLGQGLGISAEHIRMFKDGFSGIISILSKGEYQGLAKTFGLEEDSKIVTWLMSIHEAFKSVADSASRMSAAFGGMKGAEEGEKVGSVWEWVGGLFRGIGAILAPIASFLSDTISFIIGKIKELFSGMSITDGISVGIGAMFIAVLASVRSFFSNFTAIFKEGAAAFSELGDVFGALSGNLKAMQRDVQATALLKIAAALLVLAGAMWVLASISPQDLGKSGAAMVGLMAALVGTMAAMDKFASGGAAVKMPFIAAGLILLAGAMLLFALAIKAFSMIDQDDLIKGGIAMSATIGVLVGAANLLGKASVKMAIAAAGLLIMSVAMFAFAGVIKVYAMMDVATIGEGLGYLAAAIVILGIALKAIPVTGAVAMVVAAAGLMVLVAALAAVAALSGGDAMQAILTIGAALGILALGLTLMMLALPGALALVVASVGLIALAGAMMMLSMIPIAGLVVGFITIIAMFGVLALAAILLTPVIPLMLALAAAIAILGVGMALIGVGMLAFATGFSILAAAGAAGSAVLVSAVVGIAKAIPLVMTEFAKGIIEFIKTIAAGSKDIVKAIVDIVLELLDGLREILPDIVSLVIEFIEHLIVEILGMIPRIVEAGLQMINGLLDGVASNIGGIIESASQIIIQFIEGIGAGAADIADAGMTMIIDFINSLSESISTNAPLLKDALTNLATAGLEALGLGFETVGDIASAMIDGLVNGIKAGLSKVADAAKDIAKGALDGAKRLLGIHSPSKEFEKIGKFVNQGFAKGLKGGSRESVNAAYNTMKDQLTDLMKSTSADVKKAQEQLSKLTKARKKDYAAINKAKQAVAAAKVENQKATRARNTLIKSLNDERIALANLASKYESVTKKLEDAREAYKDAIQVRNDYKASIKDQYKQLPDFLNNATLQKGVDKATAKYDQLNAKVEAAAQTLQDANQKMSDSAQQIKDQFSALPSIDEETSATSYIQSLKDQILATEKFNRDLATLRSIGLDDETYQDLLTKGFSTQPFIDSLLAGGPEAVAEIDKLNNVLTEEARRLGMTTSEEMYMAGVTSAKDVSEGLKKQLKAEEAAVKKASANVLDSYVNDLKAQSKATNALRSGLDKLRAMGLNDAVYEDILAKGVDSQPFVDSLLKAGKSGVSQVNSASKGLVDAANAMGNVASKSLYQASVNAAKGIVDGLAKQEKNIQTQMDRIANIMVASIKKQLQIKSPSRVMRKLGTYTGEGLVEGLLSMGKVVEASSAKVGDSAVAALRDSLKDIDNVLPADMTLNPTIRPILDLSSVRKDAGQIDGILGSGAGISTKATFGNASSMVAENKALVNAVLASREAELRVGDSITFVQNNNSPKALPSSEIYRQTKNQISKVKGALNV